MENSGNCDMAPPTADIKNLHRELEQLFAGTQVGGRGSGEKADAASGGACLVIKGK